MGKDINMNIKLSRSDWMGIGKRMGWLKTAQLQNSRDDFGEMAPPRKTRVEKTMHAEEFSDRMPEIMGVTNSDYQISISAVVLHSPMGAEMEDEHEELDPDEPMRIEAFDAVRLNQQTDELEPLSDEEMVQFNKELQKWLKDDRNAEMVKNEIIGMARSM